ncbi:MAG: YfhO family protein [Saprospiraceae bacterium]|nr:YfhO family protein [Saprospiraceae bacterium]MBP7679827.1 YfhO family protein [Saprospiraceae bacterium]
MFKRITPHLIAFGVFLVLAVVYFMPLIKGNVIQQGDIISWKGMVQEAMTYKERTGIFPLWTNSMFSGMPTFTMGAPFPSSIAYNFLAFVNKIWDPVGHFIFGMVCFYILLITLRVNRWVSMVGAVAFMFTTYHFEIIEAGHLTKLATLAYMSLVVAGVITAYRGNYLRGAVLFAIGIAIDIACYHIQMTYYVFLIMLIYLIGRLIHDIRTGQLTQFAKATAYLLVAGIIGLGVNASNLLTTYDYAKETMRGGSVLTQNATAKKSSGLEWDYAMQWSQGWGDVLTIFVPGIVGGSSAEQLGASSETYQELSRKGANVSPDMQLPLYYGALPFTSGPIYFGAGVLMLFVLGLQLYKGHEKWWLLIATILTLLLSMGKHFSGLNEFFFNYFPMYNKFRSPNSIAAITAFTVVLLAFLGVAKVFSKEYTKSQLNNALYISVGTVGGICLFFWLMGTSFFSFTGSEDERYAQMGLNVQALIADRKAYLRSDALRSLLIILATGGLIWAFINEKLKEMVVVAGIGVITLFDLWAVGKRYLNDDSYVSATEYNANFATRPVDEQILQDKDPSYRVLDVSVNTFNSSRPSYYHKTIGGYSPAKMQRYQDIIDRHISKNNMNVLNMLNTRYVITKGQDGKEMVQRNPTALGNAWFVSSVQTAASPDAEIDSLTNLNAAENAIIHKEFASYLNGFTPNKNGTIQLTAYSPDKMTYTTNATSEQLAVFSEVWYPRGWNAYVDDKPVPHIRANYILRAMRIPAGQHSVEFRFEPAVYKTGGLISMLFSFLMVGGILGLLGLAYKRGDFNTPIAEEQTKPLATTQPKQQPSSKPKKR